MDSHFQLKCHINGYIIESVRPHAGLYKMTDEKYVLKNKTKFDIFQQIADNVYDQFKYYMTAKEVENTWDALVKQYESEKRKIKRTPSGSGYRTHWAYFDQMTFLDEEPKHRPIISSLSLTNAANAHPRQSLHPSTHHSKLKRKLSSNKENETNNVIEDVVDRSKKSKVSAANTPSVKKRDSSKNIRNKNYDDSSTQVFGNLETSHNKIIWTDDKNKLAPKPKNKTSSSSAAASTVTSGALQKLYSSSGSPIVPPLDAFAKKKKETHEKKIIDELCEVKEMKQMLGRIISIVEKQSHNDDSNNPSPALHLQNTTDGSDKFGVSMFSNVAENRTNNVIEDVVDRSKKSKVSAANAQSVKNKDSSENIRNKNYDDSSTQVFGNLETSANSVFGHSKNQVTETIILEPSTGIHSAMWNTIVETANIIPPENRLSFVVDVKEIIKRYAVNVEKGIEEEGI